MTQFWRLFTSDYLQDFLDSASIPTMDELVKAYSSQFDKEIEVHKTNIRNLLK